VSAIDAGPDRDRISGADRAACPRRGSAVARRTGTAQRARLQSLECADAAAPIVESLEDRRQPMRRGRRAPKAPSWMQRSTCKRLRRHATTARRWLHAARACAAQVFDFPVSREQREGGLCRRYLRHKGRELFFIRQCLEKLGQRVVTVDLATSSRPSTASVHPREVARHHPDGEGRGVRRRPRPRRSARWRSRSSASSRTRRDVGGLISAGGSGGTTLATAGDARAAGRAAEGDGLDDGVGDTRPYVGPSDICMMYSVTDVQGINRISEKVLANAAHALAGMIAHPPPAESATQAGARADDVRRHDACVQAVTKRLEASHDCLGLPCDRRRRPVDGESCSTRACSPARSTSRRPRSPTRSAAACCRPGRRGSMRFARARCPTSALAARST
jgi:hypothetical protein